MFSIFKKMLNTKEYQLSIKFKFIDEFEFPQDNIKKIILDFSLTQNKTLLVINSLKDFFKIFSYNNIYEKKIFYCYAI